MNTDLENRQEDFDNCYLRTYGCYPEDEDYTDEDGNPLDEDEIREIEDERTRCVRRKLGWR